MSNVSSTTFSISWPPVCWASGGSGLFEYMNVCVYICVSQGQWGPWKPCWTPGLLTFDPLGALSVSWYFNNWWEGKGTSHPGSQSLTCSLTHTHTLLTTRSHTRSLIDLLTEPMLPTRRLAGGVNTSSHTVHPLSVSTERQHGPWIRTEPSAGTGVGLVHLVFTGSHTDPPAPPPPKDGLSLTTAEGWAGLLLQVGGFQGRTETEYWKWIKHWDTSALESVIKVIKAAGHSSQRLFWVFDRLGYKNKQKQTVCKEFSN